MYTFHAFLILIGLLAASITAFPHDLMVNNEFVRDVGVLFSNSNYTGEPSFLIQHKHTPKCETNIADRVATRSAQICVPSMCTLFVSKDCSPSAAGQDLYFKGPVDVENFPNKKFNSYVCGTIEAMAPGIGDRPDDPTTPEGGYWGFVVR